MYRNGVSHMTANDDFAGVSKIVEWLSFIPAQRGLPVPIAPTIDSWDRDNIYTPPGKQPYDVRWLIGGKEDEEGFQPGLFDKDSFVETLGGWARSVVVGRARLGGIPMGVIAVETRTVENVTPADPANPDSVEQVTNEAGGVWYPNSAFKTAQAINDFNYGEQLPLMILANWRGFSGGQRDMYNEVLKYGSYIVDALVKFEQPIFVYIPPFGELRGGSWVVVDPTINPVAMEMYADAESRAGVLEPEGIIGIKFKREKQLQTMARLDPTYASLKREAADPNLPKKELEEVKEKLVARERQLLPIYAQISLQFADLHDRAGRMKAKGTIREVIEWKNARRFFYWRVRRRLNEEYILKRITAAAESSATDVESRRHYLRSLAAWTGVPDFDRNDKDVVTWYEANAATITEKVEQIKAQAIATKMGGLLSSDTRTSAIKGLRDLLHNMPISEREEILKYLK